MWIKNEPFKKSFSIVFTYYTNNLKWVRNNCPRYIPTTNVWHERNKNLDGWFFIKRFRVLPAFLLSIYVTRRCRHQWEIMPTIMQSIFLHFPVSPPPRGPPMPGLHRIKGTINIESCFFSSACRPVDCCPSTIWLMIYCLGTNRLIEQKCPKKARKVNRRRRRLCTTTTTTLLQS